MSQLSLFDQPPDDVAKAHDAINVGNGQGNWRLRENDDGPPEYRAMVEMLHFVDWLKLNDWQKKVLWPHLRKVRASLSGVTSPERLRFELGYVVGMLEVEQLRSRDSALQIAKHYGVEF